MEVVPSRSSSAEWSLLPGLARESDPLTGLRSACDGKMRSHEGCQPEQQRESVGWRRRVSAAAVSPRDMCCGQWTLPPGLARGSGLLHGRKSIVVVAWHQHSDLHMNWGYDSAALCLLAGLVPCTSSQSWRPLLPGLARESGPSLSPCDSCSRRKMQRSWEIGCGSCRPDRPLLPGLARESGTFGW